MRCGLSVRGSARRGTIVGDDRIHSTKSADGTEIAGHVRGSGRPLVLVHGGLGDGNPDMNMMLPFLVGHFRCFLMNTRGRGLSADSNDHSRERMYEDVVAFADSIGEPTILFGHSSGATWVLGAISRSRSCVGAALYEPALPVARPVITEEAYERFASVLGEGRAAEAALLSLDAVGRTVRRRTSAVLSRRRAHCASSSSRVAGATRAQPPH